MRIVLQTAPQLPSFVAQAQGSVLKHLKDSTATEESDIWRY